MFDSFLENIWKKIKEGKAVTLADRFVLWANGIGFFGLLWFVAAIVCFVMSAGKGGFLGIINYWDAFLICGTVFVVKNWEVLQRIVTKNWHKLFPKKVVDK